MGCTHSTQSIGESHIPQTNKLVDQNTNTSINHNQLSHNTDTADKHNHTATKLQSYTDNMTTAPHQHSTSTVAAWLKGMS